MAVSIDPLSRTTKIDTGAAITRVYAVGGPMILTPDVKSNFWGTEIVNQYWFKSESNGGVANFERQRHYFVGSQERPFKTISHSPGHADIIDTVALTKSPVNPNTGGPGFFRVGQNGGISYLAPCARIKVPRDGTFQITGEFTVACAFGQSYERIQLYILVNGVRKHERFWVGLGFDHLKCVDINQVMTLEKDDEVVFGINSKSNTNTNFNLEILHNPYNTDGSIPTSTISGSSLAETIGQPILSCISIVSVDA